jgi:hypothetical protein
LDTTGLLAVGRQVLETKVEVLLSQPEVVVVHHSQQVLVLLIHIEQVVVLHSQRESHALHLVLEVPKDTTLSYPLIAM